MIRLTKKNDSSYRDLYFLIKRENDTLHEKYDAFQVVSIVY